MEVNAQSMVIWQHHLGLSIINARQHQGPVTITINFEQIHKERQSCKHTPLLLMMSTRVRKKMMTVIRQNRTLRKERVLSRKRMSRNRIRNLEWKSTMTKVIGQN
jgi:hypothetical protein